MLGNVITLPSPKLARTATSAAILFALAANMVFAAGQPDLVPGFNTKTGVVTVKNSSNAPSGKSVATIGCATAVPAGCPEPAPAAIAPYENPAFPNVASVKIGPIAPSKKKSHSLSFYKDLVWAPGTYWLTVCADAGNDVAESNERNNCRRFKKVVRDIKGPQNLKSR
mgnify:CR=1 FL=1